MQSSSLPCLLHHSPNWQKHNDPEPKNERILLVAKHPTSGAVGRLGRRRPQQFIGLSRCHDCQRGCRCPFGQKSLGGSLKFLILISISLQFIWGNINLSPKPEIRATIHQVVESLIAQSLTQPGSLRLRSPAAPPGAVLRARKFHLGSSCWYCLGMGCFQSMLKRISLDNPHLAFCLLVVHQASVSIVRLTRINTPNRSAHSSAGVLKDSSLYNPSTAIFLTECLKAAISTSILASKIHARSHTSSPSSGPGHFKDILLMIVPALLYTLQNHLLYIGLAQLDTPIFLVTSQLKILTTALCSVLLCKRILTLQQWLSLGLLALGVILVQFQHNSLKVSFRNEVKKSNQLKGFGCIVLASLLSGLAGCWFERLLKFIPVNPKLLNNSNSIPLDSQSTTSNIQNQTLQLSDSIDNLWEKNIQLCIPTLIISYLSIYLDSQSRLKVTQQGFFFGYNSLVWFVVCYQAIGGILVSILVKQSSTLTKNFASSLAIILSTIVTALVNRSRPGIYFLIGTTLVFVSIKLYSSSLAKISSSLNKSKQE
ncbi:hypothetical protein O181_070502 [Austropuccinia psidii MF-1]|uniref:Uncharacterized protein n=1 Tax=Austropuccinia psidii MF-1 TaxID=1389203 RepID=A0A9Q3I8C2_9BASI|nr:hypothetical protein [Austropuccinia psidii MF-1]